MKSLQTAFMLIVGLTTCIAQSKEAWRPKLDLAGALTLHIKSVPQTELLPVKLITYHSFPQYDVSSIHPGYRIYFGKRPTGQ